jgi:hypothetical protein
MKPSRGWQSCRHWNTSDAALKKPIAWDAASENSTSWCRLHAVAWNPQPAGV